VGVWLGGDEMSCLFVCFGRSQRSGVKACVHERRGAGGQGSCWLRELRCVIRVSIDCADG
jgi:hypothetical protein